jgi:outer membrane protein OmpA-like peptidoglycan-associated protein
MFAQETQIHRVIVGAFANEHNATVFLHKVHAKFSSAEMMWVEEKKLYYVHLFVNNNLDLAKNYLVENNIYALYPDAWIYHEGTGQMMRKSSTTQNSYQTIIGETGTIDQETPIAEPILSRPQHDRLKNDSLNLAKKSNVKEKHQIIIKTITPKGKISNSFIFLTNKNVKKELSPPFISSNVDEESIITGTAVGYKSFKIKASELVSSIKKGDTTAFIHLDPLQKGDFIEFSTVEFHKNSAFMTIDSEAELRELLVFLNEYPQIEIMIHGHTNGKEKVIATSPSDKESAFVLKVSSKGKKTSASKLGLWRAEAIKQFLISNGIKPTRMEVKSHGGDKMIYSKSESQGILNNRVEIEILRDK